MWPLPRFFGTREDKSPWCFKPFHHISHFSRQHFHTVLPMWLASLVVILWRIDWNPSRLGCQISATSGEIRRVEREASESEVEKHCSMKLSLCFPIVLTPMNVMIGDCITQVNVFFSLKDHHVVFLGLHNNIAPFNRNEPFQWHLWEGGPSYWETPMLSFGQGMVCSTFWPRRVWMEQRRRWNCIVIASEMVKIPLPKPFSRSGGCYCQR